MDAQAYCLAPIFTGSNEIVENVLLALQLAGALPVLAILTPTSKPPDRKL